MGIPGYLEHPGHSWAWQLSWMKELLASGKAKKLIADQCQYGRPFKKATGILLWGRAETHPFRTCKGSRGMCSCTGEPHELLRGLIPGQKVFATSAAQEYPPALAGEIASQFF